MKRFGLPRAYLLCDRDRIVNFTPPISGAVNAHSASPALPRNLSLADLLFADSPANSESDFRAIAATLFGVESSTQTQSPTNIAINAKKPMAGVSADKAEPRKLKETSDPESSGTNAELFVPLENIPVQPIQLSAKPNAGDDKQLNSTASDRSNQLGLIGLPRQAQINNNASTTKLAGATPNDRIPPTAVDEPGTPIIQPASQNALNSGTLIATPITIPENGIARKKGVEPAKPPVDHSQPPIVPQDSKQPAPSVASTDRAQQSTNSNVLGSRDKLPPVAIDALPPNPPVDHSLDAPANKVIDDVVAEQAVPQSGLANSVAVAGSKNASGRNAPSASAKIKIRDVKDSRMASAQNGKPGFIQVGQVTEGSANAPGNGKDSSGLFLSGHPGAHAKPAVLKQSLDGPSSPASLTDTDGPDETLPTSESSPITAKLVQGMSQSEFRVGMQSQEFGNIDIRTSVARHMFSAQISVEHSDVAKSLTAQLPGLYHRLADQQVAVGNIVIHGQTLGTSSGLAQDAQRQSWQPQGHSADASTAKLNAEPVLPLMTEGIDSAGRLDIRI